MSLKELVDNLVAFNMPNNRLDLSNVDNLKFLMANLGKSHENACHKNFNSTMAELMDRYKKVVNQPVRNKK